MRTGGFGAFLTAAATCGALLGGAADLGAQPLPANAFLRAPCDAPVLEVLIQQGTTPRLDAQGRVLSGVLAKDATLPIPDSPAIGQAQVLFKAGSPVTFDRACRVTTGTLATDTILHPPAITGVGQTSVLFQAGTVAAFNDQGFVLRGVLAKTTILYPTSRSTYSYPAGTAVRFNADGTVAQSPESPPPSGGNGTFAGRWRTVREEGSTTIVMTFMQTGSNVTGSYALPGGGQGKISGVVAGQTLSGTYQDAQMPRSDAFEFVLSAEGDAFTGYCTRGGRKFSWAGIRSSRTP